MLQTLDTLIAFVTVTLVLSLLVTGIVQFIQYTFRFRGRNLERGVAGLLAAFAADDDGARKVAGAVVRDAKLVHPPPGKLHKWLSERWTIFQGRATWIEKDELKQALGRALENEKLQQTLKDKAVDLDLAIEDHFERWERNLSKWFQHRMRWISLVLSLVVVVGFQVDAMDLLKKLSADAELRDRIAGVTGDVLEEEAEVRRMLNLRDAAEEALERLELRHPDLEGQIEEASGVGADRASIVAELEAILADRPNEQRDAVVEEYRQLLDDVYDERRRRAQGLIDDAMGYTARLGLDFWGDPSFYRGAPASRYLGVLTMVILVGFGAPFWFNQLRNLVALRDMLKPKEENGK